MEELARKHDMQEGNLFSMLWSAIGKNFYARFGWQPFLSSHLALPPRAWDGLPKYDTAKSKIKDMYAEDVKKHMCSDAVMAKLREQMASENSANAKVAVLPDFDHFAWHWSREDFFVQKQLPDRSPPVIKGAGDDDVCVYCTWTRYFDENPGFYILRWVYDDPKSSDDEKILVQAIATLLRRAQQESHEWGVGNVVIWNPPPLVHKAATVIDPELQIVHRDRDICSLRWTGDQHGLSKDVEWVLNERYAWC